MTVTLRPGAPLSDSAESARFDAAGGHSTLSQGSSRLAAIERLLVYASRAIAPLAALTPLDARPERERLTSALRAGKPLAPRWRYAPARADDGLRHALDAAESVLERHPECALDALYVERIRELALEAALCDAVGTRALGPLATARFAPRQRDAHECHRQRDARTAALCARWLTNPGGPDEDITRTEPRSVGSVGSRAANAIRSDSPDPGSLLQRVRAEVGRLGLSFAVQPAPALAALAATGENVILIATGRMLTPEIVERTVLHEVHGHAAPRARAHQASSVLFRVGTARGVDDQEGRALWLEQRAGWLRAARRRQLAARHDAARAMEDGATFEDVVLRLARTHGASFEEAVVVAERVFRGSDGTFPGLGRERVYLPALLRVRAWLAKRPEDDAVLASGQIAVDAIDALRGHAPPLDDQSSIRLRRSADLHR